MAPHAPPAAGGRSAGPPDLDRETIGGLAVPIALMSRREEEAG